MYINPFWAGVGMTLLVEFILVLLVGLFSAMKVGKDSDGEDEA